MWPLWASAMLSAARTALIFQHRKSPDLGHQFNGVGANISSPDPGTDGSVQKEGSAAWLSDLDGPDARIETCSQLWRVR